MQLVPRGPSTFELIGVAIADRLIRAGQALHRRYAVVASEGQGDALFIRLERWRTLTMQFITFGDPLYFSQRAMAEAGIARRGAWEAYTRVLKAAGLLVAYPQSGTYWAYPWNKRGALVMIRRKLIELPYPTEGDAPPLFVGPAADTQLAQHTQLAQVSTVFLRGAPRPPRVSK